MTIINYFMEQSNGNEDCNTNIVTQIDNTILVQSSGEDQHVEILEKFLDSDDKLEAILGLYSNRIESGETPPSYYNVLFGVLTSYISGEFDENDITMFLLEYYDSFKGEENKFEPLLTSWDNYIKYKLSEQQVYEILIKLLLKVREIQTFNNKKINPKKEYDRFNLVITNSIWKIESFRKSIKCAPKQPTGKKYITNGLFCSLFTENVYVYDFKSIYPLLEDQNCRETLVNYLYNIIHVNLPYTYDNLFSVNFNKCSNISYNTFIFRMIICISKNYSLFDELLNYSTANINKFIIKDYDTSDKDLPLCYKLYLTLLYAIPICHVSALREYFTKKSELSQIEKVDYKTSQMLISKRIGYIIEIENIVKLLDIDTNDYVQMLYAEYLNMSKYVYCENVYNDITLYLDFITLFTKVETFYGEQNVKLYELLSKIVGNCDEESVNIHIRYDACVIIMKIYNEVGFTVFINLFENLFKYMGEVKFFDWTPPNSAIDHQYKLVEAICMLTDSYKFELDGSRTIVAGTLFILLKKSVEIFENMIRTCNLIKNNRHLIFDSKLFEKMINIVAITLEIHQNVYEKQIIKTIYPEVENEYAVLICELLSASTNCTNEIYTVLKRPDLAAKITRIAFSSLSSHIKFYPDYLIKIKEIILSNVESYSRLNRREKDIIIEILNSDLIEIKYSEEFLDPILCTPIHDPVKIPEVNEEIFDRVGIITHIYTSKENPYTRKPLTVQLLEDYNNQEHIKKEINEFIEKKKQFEKEYLENLKFNER
jgi:hypothetical protein